MSHAEDRGEYYRVPPMAETRITKFVEEGERRISSKPTIIRTTPASSLAGMKELLLHLDVVRRIARGESVSMDD
jgi:hypothetical protein